MKTEDQAWRELQQHAVAQLRPDFANRVIRAAHGPDAAAWQQLQSHAAAQLRPGFAERVLRAARAIPGVPSLLDQFALSAATAALCLLGVVLVHSHNTQLQEQRNLARWQQLADEAQDADIGQ
ncbi:MAG TPA: hypothetical protein VHE61_13695 [Opitutaceae bacterium]|nr:hypothetical protein [Opitutaceae bacterium]